MLPAGFPEYSLGWDILDWGSTYLAQPDGDNQGDPWVYSNEQAMFILWFYAVDEKGKFLFRKAVLERPKGWGKSPLLAAICCTEFMGPVRFAGWDANGKPVGRPAPSPLVQIAAISDSQAENTYELCREMMMSGRLSEECPQLDVMLAKSVFPGGRKLEKVTASPRGREGNRATFVVMDETHLWVPAERGPELHGALTRNLNKMIKQSGGRSIETTNAPVPGQNSVAEKTHDAYEQMVERGGVVGVLFDTREVEIDDIYDKEKAFPALRYVYGDALDPETGWQDIEDIWTFVNDPQNPESEVRRFWFNQRVRPPSAWLKFSEWQDCKTPGLKLRNGDKIALGFKGTTKGKAAALVAVRLTDGALFNMGFWEKPLYEDLAKPAKSKDGPEVVHPEWSAPWDEIDARVRNVLDHYDCIKLVSDAVHRRDIVSGWYADYEKVVEEFWFSNRGKFSRVVEQFEDAVTGHRIKWWDEDISRHVLNSHMEEVPNGHIIRQETPYTDRYISAAQAALLAIEAASLAVQDGALHKDDFALFDAADYSRSDKKPARVGRYQLIGF